MGLRYPDQKNHNCFFLTTSFNNHNRLGDINGFYEALADSLNFYSDKYDTKISGYVFMPTHIHMLLFIDGVKLPSFMRDFKKYISQKAAKDLNIPYSKIWEPGFDRVAINSKKVLEVKLNYIHNNPVKSGLVNSIDNWRWSSAGDYLSEKVGEIPIWKDWA